MALHHPLHWNERECTCYKQTIQKDKSNWLLTTMTMTECYFSRRYREGVVAVSVVCPGTMVSGTDQWSSPLGALKTLVLTSSSVICPVVPVVCEVTCRFSPLSSRCGSTLSWINVTHHDILSIKHTLSDLLWLILLSLLIMKIPVVRTSWSLARTTGHYH